MTLPVKVQLRGKRGADNGVRIPLYNESGTPYDTTGWQARLDIRTAPDRDEGTKILTLDESTGLIFGTGTLDISLSSTNSLLLAEDTVYYFDVLVDPTGGARICWAEGDIILTDTITTWEA
jgi:hypothetical protein